MAACLGFERPRAPAMIGLKTIAILALAIPETAPRLKQLRKVFYRFRQLKTACSLGAELLRRFLV